LNGGPKAEEQNRTEQNRTEQNRTEQNRTEQNRTEQNRTEQNRTEHASDLGAVGAKKLDPIAVGGGAALEDPKLATSP